MSREERERLNERIDEIVEQHLDALEQAVGEILLQLDK